jgi:hypothetical protein
VPDAVDIISLVRDGHCIMRAVLAIVLVGCASSPQYTGIAAPTLADAPTRHDADEVRIEVRPNQWFDIASQGGVFMLAFAAPHAPPTSGRALGALRSDDIHLDSSDEMRCAWQVVPFGDERPCIGVSRVEAMTKVQPAIHRAFDELRAKAGQAGATVVGNVRCYSTLGREQAHLWCEGTALVPDSTLPDRVEVDPSEPTTADIPVATNRLALAARGGVTLLGSDPVVTAALVLRYRPIEIAWELGALEDHRSLATIGASATWRIALPPPGLDAIVGAQASAVLENNATNPVFHGLYEGFTGVMYQTSWKISGVAQPYVQLRIGAAHAHAILPAPTVPMFGLAIGLSSPER